VTPKGQGARKPRVPRAERPRRRAWGSDLVNQIVLGAPPLGNETSAREPGVILCRGLSLRAEAAVRISSSGCEAGNRYPLGWSVADLADPGYAPVSKSRHPLVPGTLPAEVAAHWECRFRLLVERPVSESSCRSRRCTRAAPLFSGERSPTVRFGRAA